ncbi:MAG: C39 family peptidase [Chloroflexota bacterium]
MRLFRLILIIGLILFGVTVVVAGPTLLRSIPTRYVMRLPEPLQALALPSDQAPLLPTVAAPVAAQGLIFESSAPDGTAAPPASPTPLPVDIQYTNPAGGGIVDDSLSQSPTLAVLPTATPSPTPWPVPQAARMTGFTHHYQEWNNCGPATLTMALTYFGLYHSQQQTGNGLRPHPEDRNVTPEEMAAYVNNQTKFKAISRVNGDLNLLRRLLANDIPVIIEVGIDPPGEYRWLGWYGHYLLPVAYDDLYEQVWVYDSWLGTSEVPQTNADPNGRIMPYSELAAYWSQFNHNYIVLYRPEQEADVLALLGEELNDDKMWANNLAQVQLDASREPGNAFSWFNMGTAYNAVGEYEKAATAFDQALAIGLPWRMLWYQFGPYEAYYQVGRYDDILLLTETTLKDRPYFEESFYYRGLAEAALGNMPAARENLERAYAFNPNFTPANLALAELQTDG